MCRVASVLLATSAASAAPPPDWIMNQPAGRTLEQPQAIILVSVVESNPSSPRATVQVVKSWKGPYSAGQTLHTEEPGLCSGPLSSCTPYQFQADDKELLIFVYDARYPDKILAAVQWVWSAAESPTQVLMAALDQAVIQCPTCANPSVPATLKH